MGDDFRGRVENERADLLGEIHGVAARAWRKVGEHIDLDSYTPWELARVAGIAATNVARIAAAIPVTSDVDYDAPLTEEEVAQVRRIVGAA